RDSRENFRIEIGYVIRAHTQSLRRRIAYELAWFCQWERREFWLLRLPAIPRFRCDSRPSNSPRESDRDDNRHIGNRSPVSRSRFFLFQGPAVKLALLVSLIAAATIAILWILDVIPRGVLGDVTLKAFAIIGVILIASAIWRAVRGRADAAD